MIRTAIILVALLFIAGGIRLVWGKTLSPPEPPERTAPETDPALPEEFPAPDEPEPVERENPLPGELPQEEE